MNEQEISSGTRLGSMLLDHIIMSFIAMIFSIPQLVSSLIQGFGTTSGSSNHDLFPGNNYIGLIGFALYFCKDSINGRSFAKRILKLQVVDINTGRAASPLQCLLRNIFCILWPIEVIVSLVNPNRRIGDRVARTKLVPYNATAEQSLPNYIQIAIVLVLTYGAVLLGWSRLNSFQNEFMNRNALQQDLYIQQGK